MLLKSILNLGLALAGGAAIMVANDNTPNSGVPAAEVRTVSCDKPCDAPCGTPCGKPGDCTKCPNGKVCCKKDGGKVTCCRVEDGKCAPCPPGQCKLGDCPMLNESGTKCVKAVLHKTVGDWAKASPCKTVATSSCATAAGNAAPCATKPGCCAKAAAGR